MWIKSSKCDGASTCVEVDLDWERSARCDTNTCVEVAPALTTRTVRVRDGKNPEGPVLSFSAEAWNNFLDDIKNGQHRFERSSAETTP